VQCAAVASTIAFSALVTFLLLKGIGATMGIRSIDEHQSEGLDLVEHGEKGYHELA
jgi:Amt family ammonium transporter